MSWLQRRATHLKKWWMPYIVGGVLAGVIVLFILTLPLIGKVSRQAQSGAAARARQCKTLPISTKVFTAAEKRGEISRGELADFKQTSLPPGCKHLAAGPFVGQIPHPAHPPFGRAGRPIPSPDQGGRP